MKNVVLTVRINSDLRDSFNHACALNDLPASIVLRELMKRYIKENSQLDLLKGSKK